jgi:hypothetical protein
MPHERDRKSLLTINLGLSIKWHDKQSDSHFGPYRVLRECDCHLLHYKV